MIATIVVPAVVLVVGCLMYALAANPKVSEMGRIAYFVGLLWLVYEIMGRALHF
jgi:hypothetical protein